MKAVVIGATGATGSDLIKKLLKDDFFSEVVIFVRRKSGFEHSKLQEYIIDYDQISSYKEMISGAVFFSCLGTTLKTAGSKEKQWIVDYDYQYEFAQLAKENKVTHYILVSSAHASANARFYYPRMKGQLEEAVIALRFENTTIFRPPMLLRKGSDRKGELIAAKVIRFLNSIGLWNSQRPLDTKVLAEAMITVCKKASKPFQVISGQEIRKIVSI
ncbi:MAG: NAD(P)H-binding protein [Flavobacteriales bacterium]|jgi:uncharacterized protein YbjT (DUF2867 family)|nr:NAD(P)H-binding protein [Flavobacteriales bacterium]